MSILSPKINKVLIVLVEELKKKKILNAYI